MFAVCGLISTIFVWAASASEESALGRASADARTPPFSAAVKTRFARVRLHPEAESPEIGVLREGATVTVTACKPDCTSSHGWALLGADGAIKFALLNPQPREAATTPNAETSWYGRIGKSAFRIFKQPRPDGPILARNQKNREMAFLPNVDLRTRGWLERVEGGFVPARRVQMLTPSRFQGEPQPHLPLAFVVRNMRVAAKIGLQRYDRVPVREIDKHSVVTDSGPLTKKAARIITRHSRPPIIPAGAKWVLVDLGQQTLTAYEGDVPVFATLISSGKDHDESETHPGLYRVEHKMDYSDMHGEPDEPYGVDRVPYVLYFHKNEALHGTYWHDRFGFPASHGCVNLSPADARWLFEWAPPRLPDNWSTIDPKAAGLGSLWVFIKEKATL